MITEEQLYTFLFSKKESECIYKGILFSNEFAYAVSKATFVKVKMKYPKTNEGKIKMKDEILVPMDSYSLNIISKIDSYIKAKTRDIVDMSILYKNAESTKRLSDILKITFNIAIEKNQFPTNILLKLKEFTTSIELWTAGICHVKNFAYICGNNKNGAFGTTITKNPLQTYVEDDMEINGIDLKNEINNMNIKAKDLAFLEKLSKPKVNKLF